MKLRHSSLSLILLLLAPSCPLAQSATFKTAAPASPRLEELQEKGSQDLLNLDYDAARQIFKEMTRLFPDDPSGPEMLASTLWLEALNKLRLRQAAIYSSQSFEENTDDKPDPQMVQEFRDLTRQATQLAKARLQRNAHDPQTLYTLGAIATLRASFELTIERHYFAALREGSSGIDRDREVIKLDPNFHDAELNIGLFDYVVGNLPLPAKLAASFVGAQGSKKRGLQTLERVAKEGHTQPRLLLLALYKHEKRLSDSLALSRELQEKYPHNYLFRLETADTLVSQALVERQANRSTAADPLEKEALNTFDLLLRERSPSNGQTRGLELIHFRYGEALLMLGHAEPAARQFLAAAAVAVAEPAVITRAHLRAAQSLDLTGKRNEALAEYRIVLTRPNTRDSLDQARRGLKEPYKLTK
jgi:hypothetical protein